MICRTLLVPCRHPVLGMKDGVRGFYSCFFQCCKIPEKSHNTSIGFQVQDQSGTKPPSTGGQLKPLQSPNTSQTEEESGNDDAVIRLDSWRYCPKLVTISAVTNPDAWSHPINTTASPLKASRRRRQRLLQTLPMRIRLAAEDSSQEAARRPHQCLYPPC